MNRTSNEAVNPGRRPSLKAAEPRRPDEKGAYLGVKNDSPYY
jgi:hypothetical protein